MHTDDSRLLRHLVTAVAVKLLLLSTLWWLFVRDHAVDAGSAQTAQHLMAPAQQAAQPPRHTPRTGQETTP